MTSVAVCKCWNQLARTQISFKPWCNSRQKQLERVIIQAFIKLQLTRRTGSSSMHNDSEALTNEINAATTAKMLSPSSAFSSACACGTSPRVHFERVSGYSCLLLVVCKFVLFCFVCVCWPVCWPICLFL
jgi:hypothetical protein